MELGYDSYTHFLTRADTFDLIGCEPEDRFNLLASKYIAHNKPLKEMFPIGSWFLLGSGSGYRIFKVHEVVSNSHQSTATEVKYLVRTCYDIDFPYTTMRGVMVSYGIDRCIPLTEEETALLILMGAIVV